MFKYCLLLLVIILSSCKVQETQQIALSPAKSLEVTKPQTPIMGWSSWNNFHVNINEEVI